MNIWRCQKFMKKQENEAIEKTEKLYTKQNVLQSKRFEAYKDIFAVKLKKDKLYSMKELEEIEKTMKQKGKQERKEQ